MVTWASITSSYISRLARSASARELHRVAACISRHASPASRLSSAKST
jgi:hypothetical protein